MHDVACIFSCVILSPMYAAKQTMLFLNTWTILSIFFEQSGHRRWWDNRLGNCGSDELCITSFGRQSRAHYRCLAQPEVEVTGIGEHAGNWDPIVITLHLTHPTLALTHSTKLFRKHHMISCHSFSVWWFVPILPGIMKSFVAFVGLLVW